jgi:hypothetical protein
MPSASIAVYCWGANNNGPSNHAWCWGNGISGQLGNGSPGIYNTPQLVSGGRTYRAIAVGSQHTCAIGTDNHIYCWGINNWLGAPQFMSVMSSTPVQALDPRFAMPRPAAEP